LSDYLHTARYESLGKDDGAVTEWIVDCRLLFSSSQDFPSASMSSMSGNFREVGGGWYSKSGAGFVDMAKSPALAWQLRPVARLAASTAGGGGGSLISLLTPHPSCAPDLRSGGL
jgi:hypothetical protein